MTPKTNYNFNLDVTLDSATGRILSVNFRIRKGKASETREFGKGAAFANYGKKGELLGVELLEPCSISVLDSIAKADPRGRAFIRESVPAAMLVG